MTVQALIPALLAFVAHLVAHEGAHALAARAVGFRVLGAQRNPLAPGVLVIDDGPEGAPGPRWRWAAVHLAGPVANLVLATAATLVWAGWSGATGAARAVAGAWAAWPGIPSPPLLAVAWMGVLMAVLSLVPLPPFDGGRIVLALATGHAGPSVRPLSAFLWALGSPLFLAAVVIALST